jgi:hypothetical protein
LSVLCVTCANFSLRDPRLRHTENGYAMSRLRYGNCARMPAYTFVSAQGEHQCDMHRPAPAEQVEARIAWLATCR